MNPVPSRDGRRVFAVGEKERGELVRYDPRLKPVRPVSLGEFRSRCRVLTRRPVGRLRHLSRRRAVAESRRRERPPPADPLPAPCHRASLVSRRQAARLSGALFFGRPTTQELQLFDLRRRGATKSPYRLLTIRSGQPTAGRRTVGPSLLGQRGGDRAPPRSSSWSSRRADSRKLPGSEGLLDPHWSPDGHHLAALSIDRLRLLLHDFSSDRWREVLAGKQMLGWPRLEPGWALPLHLPGWLASALRIADGHREVVASSEGVRCFGFRESSGVAGVGSARAPDDSVITLRDLSVPEILALDWEAP